MIGRIWNAFGDFLGPTRRMALFGLLAVTGLLSLMLNAVEGQNIVELQTLLFLIFLGGAAIILFTALSPYQRGRWLGILTPSFLLIVLGSTLFREQSGLLFGLAVGWVIAAQLLFRSREPMAYQKAVRALRKNDYETAVKELDALIKTAPNAPQHYHFRARLYRLSGKLPAARRDYKKIIELHPESPVGHNELAELELQAGQYEAARAAALTAYDLSEGDWVTGYNLGMIEDRLGLSAEALAHLDHALTHKVKDSRHRLLIHLYRARALARLNRTDEAEAALERVRAERGALPEWRKLLADAQADALRAVLADDVDTAQAVLEGVVTAQTLAKTGKITPALSPSKRK
jgi:predicted Zn-dependent protease